MRTPAGRSLKNWTGPVLFWLAAALSGCSTFNQDWKAASVHPSQTDLITGRWQGMWRSDVTGHQGQLRCLLAREQQGSYGARFHATYGRVFRFGHSVLLAVEEGAEPFRFRGDADLGRLGGGIYQYQGMVTRTNFFSTYRSARDHGTFYMTWPEARE